MKKEIIIRLAKKIQEMWDGPSGMCWCEELKKYVKPNCKECPECEDISVLDQRPSKYLRPTDISW